MKSGEILLYQSPKGEIKIDVRLEDETVWLTQEQMGLLFGKSRTTITEHIQHIFAEGELQEDMVCRIPRKIPTRYTIPHLGDDVLYADVTEKSTYDDYNDSNALSGNRYTDNNKMKTNWNWGNLLTVVRWNRVWNNKLFMNATAHFTRYRFDLGLKNTFESSNSKSTNYDASIRYKSGIQDYSGKIEFDYTPNPNHDIKFGAN